MIRSADPFKGPTQREVKREVKEVMDGTNT
jgi:hypothetical protein